jgi:hypothetical protein
MKLEKIIAIIAAICGIITFADQYLLESKILNSISLPSSVPLGLFFILVAIFMFALIVVSKKNITLPYPDQRDKVENLEKKLETAYATSVQVVSLEDENLKLSEEVKRLRHSIDNNESLKSRINGILAQGSKSIESLIKELRIDDGDVFVVANFQRVLGELTTKGDVKTNALGYYELKPNKALSVGRAKSARR